MHGAHTESKGDTREQLFLSTKCLSDSEKENNVTAAAILIIESSGEKRGQKKWLRKQKTFGVYDSLLREFRLESKADYFNFLRMSPNVFNHLLDLVKGDITKEDFAHKRRNFHFHYHIPQTSFLIP